MENTFDIDYNSNNYFFLTNYSDVFKAGRNSFIVNPTQFIVPDAPIEVNVFDSKGNALPCDLIQPTNARFSEETNSGKYYYVTVDSNTSAGFGRIEITGTGLYAPGYTGSLAYYKTYAYKVGPTQRLPLLQPISGAFIPKASVTWTRNVLIDTTKPTDSEIRFFDRPEISVTPQIYSSTSYPTASYILSSGSFSAVAVNPKNNYDGDYDYQFDSPLYQIYWNMGSKFSSSMEGEDIRIKSPRIKKFAYNNFLNNQLVFEGTFDTDFICKIKKVVNDTSVLLDIPFTAVSELIGRHNEDSPYSKNNLVDIKGYTVSNDPNKQNVFHKKNFYILSIDSGDFEIFHNKIPIQNSISTNKKSILDIEINNLSVLCGNLSMYKIYGRSLNSPENSTLLCEGKIEPDEHISTNNFNNGLYNSPGKFFNSAYVSKYWKKSSANCIFEQDNSVLIDGVKIGHAGNSNQTDYIIFKDDTSTSTSTYSSYNLLQNSYWYTNRNAFLNHRAYPSSSYLGISEIPVISTYSNSQENLINGSIHDSNPVKLRAHTLYKFSMLVRSTASNTSSSKMYVYFVSGAEKIQIGYIDNSFNFGANQEYEYTFFSDISRYGTIMFAPVLGTWYISSVSLVPYQTVYHSIDSFRVKVPIKKSTNNELYEIEMELYDSQNRLAYGKNSYTFSYNHTFLPLKKKVFIDPAGITN